jgi:hypothetical protein
MKCTVCGAPAKGSISPDMDIEGLKYCEDNDHRTRVEAAYIALAFGDEEMCRDLLEPRKVNNGSGKTSD